MNQFFYFLFPGGENNHGFTKLKEGYSASHTLFPIRLTRRSLFLGNFLVLYVYLVLVFCVGFVFPHFSPFWPPAAVAAFAILAYGFRLAPGVFLGAFLGNAFILHWSVVESLLIASGNTLGPLLGARFLHRGNPSWNGFGTVRDALRFLGGMGVLGSGLTSMIGALVLVDLSPGGHEPTLLAAWLAWWTSDSCSIFMFTPAIFVWSFPERDVRSIESSAPSNIVISALILSILFVGGIIYFFPGLPEMTSLGLTGLFLPILVWVAMTRSQRTAFSLLAFVLFLQFGATAMGFGPFAHLVKNPQDAMIGMELLGMMTGFAVILVNILTLERQAAMNQLEQMNYTLEFRVETRTKDLDLKTRELGAQLHFRQLLLDSLPVPVFVADSGGRLALSNQKLGELFGVPSSDLLGKPVSELFDSGFCEMALDRPDSFPDSPEGEREDLIMLSNGKKRTFIANRVCIQSPLRGMIVSLQDISERVSLQRSIEEREQLFRLIVETLPLPMIISRKSDSVLLYANPSVGELFQIDIGLWIGKPLLPFWGESHDRDLFLSEVRQKGVVIDREFELKMPSGERLWMALSGGFSQISDEEVLIVSFRDIHEDRQRQMTLHQEIRTDFLTGLGNRKDLQETLPSAIVRSKFLVVCILDLDDFKEVNDRYGHAAGDFLLKEVSQRMRSSLRAGDYAARLGGDEFVLILEKMESREDLSRFLGRFRNIIERPISLPQGEVVSIGLSLGLTICREGDADPDLLMRQADEALYQVKSQKGSRDCWWKSYS
jgi:diguanylate cyclase (GGDEF)-like protein/PAS domain S-box-containing protein